MAHDITALHRDRLSRAILAGRVRGRALEPHRLHRLHAAKREVRIYDYEDRREPVLRRMAERRRAGYRGIGYAIDTGTPLGL